jgi:hypothetical protein
MPEVELTGVTVVAAGSFNPAIFHPSWFAARNCSPRATWTSA